MENKKNLSVSRKLSVVSLAQPTYSPFSKHIPHICFLLLNWNFYHSWTERNIGNQIRGTHWAFGKGIVLLFPWKGSSVAIPLKRERCCCYPEKGVVLLLPWKGNIVTVLWKGRSIAVPLKGRSVADINNWLNYLKNQFEIIAYHEKKFARFVMKLGITINILY